MDYTRKRRRLLVGAYAALGSALLASFPVAGQTRPQRVAFLSGGSRSDVAPYLASYLQGMRELGYLEGQTLRLDARYANYSADEARALAEEITKDNPAVIVANGGGIAPACRLDPPLPVVFLHSGDPVIAGFANSYARPGRNATGITLLALELLVKRMELLKEIQPKMKRIAFLASPEHAGQKRELDAAREGAAKLQVDVDYYEARTPAELASALEKVAKDQPDAALLFSDALMIGQRRPLAEFFLKHRIPSAAGWIAFAESGHLLSFGPERHAVWRRLATFTDRIVKGAKPADLPIELPTVFELAVNTRTAAAMKLAVPPSIAQRADKLVDGAEKL
jgi:putative ABC transport system substrate-binding protein